ATNVGYDIKNPVTISNCYSTAAVFDAGITGEWAGKAGAFANIAANATPAFTNNVWSRTYSGNAAKGIGNAAADPQGVRQLSITPATAQTIAPRTSFDASAETGADVDALGLKFDSWSNDGLLSTSGFNIMPQTKVTAGNSAGTTKLKANYTDKTTGKTYTMGVVDVTVDKNALIQIPTFDEFNKIGTDPAYPLSGAYLQTGDFNIPAAFVASRGEFSGTYDGGGKKITLLGNLISNGGATGLFSKINGGTVKNLVIEGGNIDSSAPYTGVLAGTASGAVITNVRINSATVKSIGEAVGGLIGMVDGATSITNCNIGVSVIGANTAGGFVGLYNGGKIQNSSAAGTVMMTGTASGAIAGGFVGSMNGTAIINTSAGYAAVTTENGAAEQHIGGFVGKMDGGTISTATAQGNLGGVNLADATNGGFAGTIGSGITKIENTYTLGTAGTAGLKAGSFAGKNSADAGKFQNCIVSSEKGIFGTASPVSSAAEVHPFMTIPASIATDKFDEYLPISAQNGAYDMQFASWEILSGSTGISIINPASISTNAVLAVGTTAEQQIRAKYTNNAGTAMYSPILKITPKAAGTQILVPDWATFEKIGNDPF
ncbi:MAG: hypothetical protein RR459_08235, partial [Christensenellaceae bacterium]